MFVLNVCDGQSVVDFFLCEDSALKVEKKTDLKFVVINKRVQVHTREMNHKKKIS